MRLFVSTHLMFLLILLMFIQPVQARAYTEFRDDALVCMDATQKFEKEYQIKEHLLTTISNVETGRWNEKRQQSMAWPWTINAQGRGRFFATKAEAVREVKRLQAQGVKSIDVGCMQINLAYHPKAFASVEDALDPQKNVEYGAKFLKKLHNKKGDWIKAAMAYHSSVPFRAKMYKNKLASAYLSIRQAQKSQSAPLFAQTEQAKTKKLAKNRVVVKNKSIDRIKTAEKANAWREAKVAAWQEARNQN